VVDAAPVEEVAEVEAKDEVVAGEVSDAGDWEVMEVAIWELELAEGKAGKAKFATGTSASERFFKKRLKP